MIMSRDLIGVMWHLCDAWARRDQHNIILVHYNDLLNHLEAEMRRLAQLLRISVPEEAWADLVDAATFDQMGLRAKELAPGPAGTLKDRYRFFRRGSSGSGQEALSHSEFAQYNVRASQMAPPDLLEWLHRPVPTI